MYFLAIFTYDILFLLDIGIFISWLKLDSIWSIYYLFWFLDLTLKINPCRSNSEEFKLSNFEKYLLNNLVILVGFLDFYTLDDTFFKVDELHRKYESETLFFGLQNQIPEWIVRFVTNNKTWHI